MRSLGEPRLRVMCEHRGYTLGGWKTATANRKPKTRKTITIATTSPAPRPLGCGLRPLGIRRGQSCCSAAAAAIASSSATGTHSCRARRDKTMPPKIAARAIPAAIANGNRNPSHDKALSPKPPAQIGPFRTSPIAIATIPAITNSQSVARIGPSQSKLGATERRRRTSRQIASGARTEALLQGLEPRFGRVRRRGAARNSPECQSSGMACHHSG